jgi:hypothetical protein
MKLVACLLLACATVAQSLVVMPAARPMVSRAASQGRAVTVVMDNHVHRAQVSVGETEPFEAAVKRFRREVCLLPHCLVPLSDPTAWPCETSPLPI